MLFRPALFGRDGDVPSRSSSGYASTYRLPFATTSFAPAGETCGALFGLMMVAGIVMGIAASALFGLHGVLERKAAESTNELLLPEVRIVGAVSDFPCDGLSIANLVRPRRSRHRSQ